MSHWADGNIQFSSFLKGASIVVRLSQHYCEGLMREYRARQIASAQYLTIIVRQSCYVLLCFILLDHILSFTIFV